MTLLTALLALVLAQSSEEALAKKIDSQIPWLSDGVQLIDMELAAGHHPQFPQAREAKNLRVDRGPILHGDPPLGPRFVPRDQLHRDFPRVDPGVDESPGNLRAAAADALHR